MTTTWDRIDHDPISIASGAAEQRPTIRMRHMSMSGGGVTDSATARTFHTVAEANKAITALAIDNDHAVFGVILEPDPSSLVDDALHVIIHWGFVSDRYHLDTIDNAAPGES